MRRWIAGSARLGEFFFNVVRERTGFRDCCMWVRLNSPDCRGCVREGGMLEKRHDVLQVSGWLGQIVSLIPTEGDGL